MTTIDPAPWREALASLGTPHLTTVLTVQCDLAWLRPAAATLRDEIDEALTTLAMTRPGIRIDRIVLHNLPAIGDVPPEELAALNAAHADWLYRLAASRRAAARAGPPAGAPAHRRRPAT